jgi:hypothetical protein
VDPLFEKTMTPYQYTYQNPLKYTDPTGMVPEDGGGDPPTGKRDIYNSIPTNNRGRKLVKTKTVSSGSEQNDAFIHVMNDKGETTEAFTGPNAVSKYSAKYGLPEDVEFKMSDGLNNFERTLFAIGDVTYIALTNTETNAIIFAPLEEFILAEASIGRALSSSKLFRGGKKVKLNSFDDIIANPSALYGKTINEVEKILGEGWTKGAYGSKKTGWKFTKADKSVFYHPGGGVHSGSYYGVSSGKTGKIKVVGSDYVPTFNDKASVLKK